MIKRIISFVAALIVPYLMFTLVISLNESDFERQDLESDSINFDVKKQKKITKPKQPNYSVSAGPHYTGSYPTILKFLPP